MQVETVIWDCDGVLVDSEIIAMRVAGEIIYDELANLKSHHVQNINRADFAAQIVIDYAGAHFSQMLTPFGITEEAEHNRLDAIKMERTIDELSRNVETFHRLRETLSALQSRGIKMAVATSSELFRVLPCLEKHNLTEFFTDKDGMEHIYSAVDSLNMPTPKPAPDIYLHAMKMIGANRLTSLAVEDSRSGVKSARAAGLNVVGFTGGSHIPLTHTACHAQMLTENGAFKVVSSAVDIFHTIVDRYIRPEYEFQPIGGGALKPQMR